MTTFSVVQGDGAYASNTSNNQTLFNITEGNFIVAIMSCRDGNAASTLSVSDGNGGTWTYGPSVDNELSDLNARFAMRVAYRMVGASEGTVIFTGHSSANNNGFFVAEIQPSDAYVPSIVGSSGAGSGTTTLDGVSTTTGSISGSDLLHVMCQAVRQGSAIGGFEVTQYTPTTEYDDYERIEGSNQISAAIGIALDGQTASGTITVTSDLTGSNTAAAEGIIIQMVFENSAGGGSKTGSGDVDIPATVVSGSTDIARAGTGAVIGAAPDVSGTGKRAILATGALGAVAATIAATGERIVLATGNLSATGAAVAGIGERFVTALADVQGTGATIAATTDRAINASGDVPIPVAVVEGARNEAIKFGSGDVPIPATSIDAAGKRTVPASGAVLATTAQVVAQANRLLESTGAINAHAASVDAAAKRAIIATGDVIAVAAQIAGLSESTSDKTGAGNVDAPPAQVAATGERIIEAQGDLAGTGAAVDAMGKRTVIGVGNVITSVTRVRGYEIEPDAVTTLWLKHRLERKKVG